MYLTFAGYSLREAWNETECAVFDQKRLFSTPSFWGLLVKLRESAGHVWHGAPKLNAIHASDGLPERMKTQFNRPEAGFVLSVNGARAITVSATEGRWSRVSAAANVIVAGTAPSDESGDLRRRYQRGRNCGCHLF